MSCCLAPAVAQFDSTFYYRLKEVTGRSLALEPEMGMSIQMLAWSTLSWAEGWDFAPPDTWNPAQDLWPPISTNKWMSRGSYMTHLTNRWDKNKGLMAAVAFFNGHGLNAWENVWGMWIGMTPRASAIYKRMSAILRFAGGHMHGGYGQADDAPSERALLRSSQWLPFSPRIHASNGPAFASTWESETDEEVFIGIVGFGEKSSSLFADAWFLLDTKYASSEGYHLYDCYRGLELPLPTAAEALHVPSASGGTSKLLNVSLNLEASIRSLIPGSPVTLVGLSGFTGLLLTKGGADATLQNFLNRMHNLTTLPLGNVTCHGKWHQCAEWQYFSECNVSFCAGLSQQMVPIPPTTNYTTPPTLGGEMVSVPSGINYSFQTNGVEIEGDATFGVDFQFPWETAPTQTHSHDLFVPPLWVDKYPVTNQQYFRYLNSTGWRPADTERWLTHWGSDWAQRGLPPELMDLPVVHVSLSDARAFCKHVGKRLPHR
eukprot:COSAG01_NODE_521_length_15963_cov_76.378530_10_plen_487_part_00